MNNSNYLVEIEVGANYAVTFTIQKANCTRTNIRLFHRFDDTKTFIYGRRTGFSYDLSFTSNNWLDPCSTNSAYTSDSNNQINSFNGTDYISINQAVDTRATNYARSTTGVVSEAEHCGVDNYFVKVGNLAVCVNTCPAHFPKYILHNHLGRQCINDCYLDFTYRYPPNVCAFNCIYFLLYVNEEEALKQEGDCVNTCDSPKFRFKHPDYLYTDGTQKRFCVDTCDVVGGLPVYYASGGGNWCADKCGRQGSIVNTPDSLPYLNGNECVATCGTGFLQVTEYLPEQYEIGICMGSCPPGHFQFINSDFKYSFDNSIKKYCLTNCLIADFLISYKIGSTFYCIDSCKSEAVGAKRYLNTYNSGRKECLEKCPYFLTNVESFDTAEESGECVDKCDYYTLKVPDIKWVDDTVKSYCVSHCTQLNSTHPFPTITRECSDDCQLGGYKYTMEDKSCSNTCSQFILYNIYCVSKCPDELPLSENRHCVSKCSKDYPFIKDFSTCETDCLSLKYNEYCVDQCNSPVLVNYLALKDIPYTPLPFVLTNGYCAESCLEVIAPYANEITRSCHPTCPPCNGATCLYADQIYKDPEFFCRRRCSDTDFPLTDNFSSECLSRCRVERPFILEEECLEECPKSHPLVAKRANCKNDQCNGICQDFTFTCVQECPEDLPFRMKVRDLSLCVCGCDKYYVPEGKKCKLFCNPAFGLVENETADSCLHCFYDKERQFYYNGECVDACPLGTSFNQYFVCVSCFDLNLWRNEANRCIPFSKCHYLSHFDYENKICSACDKEGHMITKRGSELACEQTNCTQGFISESVSYPLCVYCNPSEFFLDPECTALCPSKLKYDFNSRICEKCESTCTCCKNGKCSRGKCVCEKGWIGKYCNTKIEENAKITSNIISFLQKRFSMGFLIQNENELITEISNLYLEEDQKRQLVLNPKTLNGFMQNILSLVKRQRIKFAYQPVVLNTLDRLLQLAAIYTSKTGDDTVLAESLSLFYEVTGDIQIFNVTMSVIPEFEVVSAASMSGEVFDFAFGTDVNKAEQLDLTVCLEKMKRELDLAPSHLFPFRLITLKGLLENTEPQQDPFVASYSPKTMVWLYSRNGPLNIRKVCQDNFIDISFEVDLGQKFEENNQKLNLTGINLFDKQDPFFNDRCVPFSDGQDITIQKRKERFFTDSSEICNEPPSKICQIQNVKKEENKAKCVCKGIQDRKKSTLESAFSTYPKTNYVLITCVSVFKKAIITENLGFYTVITPCFLALILIYCFNLKIDTDLADEKRFQYMRSDIELFDPETMNAKIYFEECFFLKIRLDKNVIQVRQTKNFDFTSLPTLPDLKHLSIKEQLKLDYRSNWQYVKDILLQESTLYYTLCSKSLIDLKPFLIVFYVSELNLSIALNSFYIDDDMVDSLNENEEHSLISSFTRELPKTLWALLTAKLIIFILTAFYSFKERAVRLFLKRLVLTRDKSAAKAYGLFLSEHNWRLVGICLVVVPFNLFCLYFLVIYTEIYSNSLDIWMNGIIMGLIVDNLVIEGVPALVLILSRIIAKTYPSMEFLFILGSKINALKSLEILS